MGGNVVDAGVGDVAPAEVVGGTVPVTTAAAGIRTGGVGSGDGAVNCGAVVRDRMRVRRAVLDGVRVRVRVAAGAVFFFAGIGSPGLR